jgi:hypothetical protein
MNDTNAAEHDLATLRDVIALRYRSGTTTPADPRAGAGPRGLRPRKGDEIAQHTEARGRDAR